MIYGSLLLVLFSFSWFLVDKFYFNKNVEIIVWFLKRLGFSVFFFVLFLVGVYKVFWIRVYKKFEGFGSVYNIVYESYKW